ncbi:hypothetical protein ADZ37_24470 [Pannonibacter phragmitetus]|uniref:hypothetical protein n=1 Tax=Pannonibacter phragmitetus TaxID=121719 RepID=UPI00067B0CD7|nr:hypothetical protein [Pannonibacter phragmitetus]KND16173.1 hypothetical protein ADZ37_24470 [Pannonibacter phragmitetus]
MEIPTADDQKQTTKFFTRNFMLAWAGLSCAYGVLAFTAGQQVTPYLWRLMFAKFATFADRTVIAQWWEWPQLLFAPLIETFMVWVAGDKWALDNDGWPPLILLILSAIIVFLIVGFCLAWIGRKIFERLSRQAQANTSGRA